MTHDTTQPCYVPFAVATFLTLCLAMMYMAMLMNMMLKKGRSICITTPSVATMATSVYCTSHTAVVGLNSWFTYREHGIEDATTDIIL